MSQLPKSEAHQLLTNLTPIDINGQTVYIAQIQSDPASYLQAGRSSLGSVFGVGSPMGLSPGAGGPSPGVLAASPGAMSPNLITVPPSLVKPSDASYKQHQQGHKISNGDGTRKLLLPWLVEHLDKMSFRGVQWSDRPSGLFLLPWKHGKNKGFDEETDGEIFKEWAVNTGRHRRHEPPAYKVWKATLRNALHKHPHIKECKEFGKSGQFRAYQIIVPLEGIQETQTTKCGVKVKKLPDEELMGPPPPLTPKTPTNFVMSPSVHSNAGSMSGPNTPATPTNTDKNSPHDYRSTDAHSLFSPVSTISSSHSNESEYPTDLEMSPSSSVVTTVDVVTPGGASPNKQHIRSASGTVLTDFEEILKGIQVSLPDKNQEDPSEYNMDLDEMLIGSKFLTEPININQYPPEQSNLQYSSHGDKMSEQTTIHQQFLMQERRKQINFQMQKQKLKEQQEQFQQQQQQHQQQQQQFQQQQKELQLHQQNYYQQHKRVAQQVGQQQQKPLQNNLQGQNQSVAPPQPQTPSPRGPPSPSVPTLNAEQHRKLVELKKQRDSLKQQVVQGATSESKPLTVDEFPMEELLGTEPEPRRLGKRPRLENTSDIQLEGLNGTVDYVAKLKQIGLPKKQSPNSMAITIYYKTVGVAAYGISNPVGARLFFCSNQRVQFPDEKVTHELYGPKDATQICMPWCRDNTPTQTLLGTLTRGVILQEEDEDIYATRLCQCAVFFGDKRGVLTKLERGQRVKIFDFKNRFLPLYFQHLQSQSGKGSNDIVLDPFPEQDVMLSFGQRWDDRRPIANTLIWAKVIHMKSRQLTLDFTQLFPPPPPIANEDCIQFSESDPYDRLADAFSLAL